jgi:hypothetical protein
LRRLTARCALGLRAWLLRSNGRFRDTYDRDLRVHVAVVVSCSTIRQWRAVAAGEGHTVALSSDDRVFQWGDVYATVPTDIGRVARIAAGQYHSMALRFDGTVRCWGDGSWGQCAAPANLVGARAIAAGALHSIVLRSDQTVQCWGRGDNGQLNVPSGLTSVVAIAGGGAHSAALREDGTVAAWGLNASGQSSPPRLPFTRQLNLGFSHSVSVDCGVDIDLRNSPDLGAVGFGAAKTHTFTSLPPTSNGGVTLEIIARADLDLTSEFLLVTLDGQGPGSVLFATTGSANDCPVEPNRATINLTAATYASLAADGEIQVHVESSIGVNASQCAAGSVVLELAVPKFPTDCNGNGVEDSCDVRTRSDVFDCDQNGAIDSCEITSSQNLDCDQDGRLDWCQIAGGAQDKDADGVLDSCEFAIGDFDLNGVVGGPDLATLLALWGVPKPPYGDLDRNGNVGGGDLAIMLNHWGPVN